MAVSRAVWEPFGSRWGAVGEPLGLGVLGGSGAFGSVRERSGAGLLGVRGRSGAFGGGAVGQSGTVGGVAADVRRQA